MSFKKHFCPSPWFHMRINNSGTYEYCRWMTKDGSTRVNFKNNIKDTSPTEYFQNNLSDLRTELLSGKAPAGCSSCTEMEHNNKVSGRQRQLLKVGVQEKYFDKSLASSPLRPAFDYSQNNQGHTKQTVLDWQIDLGNYCNSACIFCGPESSSRLASEFLQLGLINQVPPASWCNDPVLLEKFIKDLKQYPAHYLHFLGGETLITPGFKKILSAMVDADLAQDIIVGFTTNLTVWDNSVVKLLKKFKQVNLGMSIESLTPINDYVRFPSKIEDVKKILSRWVKLGKQHSWLMQLRITPSCLTVHELTTVYDYAWTHELSVESCNFLNEPEFFKISVLPPEQRNQVKLVISKWIELHNIENDTQIINTRNPHAVREQIVQDAKSYLAYLDNTPDETNLLPSLVNFLKQLESVRKNSITSYLPQYEELFRTHGY